MDVSSFPYGPRESPPYPHLGVGVLNGVLPYSISILTFGTCILIWILLLLKKLQNAKDVSRPKIVFHLFPLSVRDKWIHKIIYNLQGEFLLNEQVTLFKSLIFRYYFLLVKFIIFYVFRYYCSCNFRF